MSSRQLIAALLGVLLLLGSPTPLLAVVVSDSQADASAEDCNGMDYARAVMDHSDWSQGCGNAQQTSCHLASSHCASAPVFGIVGGIRSPSIPTKSPANAAPGPMVYQAPVGEVLTPPPDSLS
ncbi:hypothetical protein MD273_02490 [Marinobacter pelagius]|uniref:hypothetical protein n=1 Tax=Marinobacter sp. C7 TaxID=2951363 RepID=UPI001EEFB9E7|nr:hypothetical protein [Marinobacter sp. C7]MCG7198584.1 hypothetical protein [Marinobacter sp. C7]